MKHLFSITCRFDPANPVVIPCVQSIRAHHPESPIHVVDSASEDKSYYEQVEKFGAKVEDIGNQSLTTGNIWHTYEKYPDYDFYYFLHDSMLIKDGILDLMETDVTALRYFRSWNGLGWTPQEHPSGDNGFVFSETLNWANSQLLSKTTYRPEMGMRFAALFGPMIMCKRSVLDKLKAAGFDKVRPTTKRQSEAMERVWGMVLNLEGYDLSKLSLQGYCYDPGYRENHRLEKIFLGRQ
tara:strand:+ start:29528 stop:30241 length:714 start_codon:yes stop_codon:yes gene_type:complete